MANIRIPPDQLTDSMGKAVRGMASEQPERTLRVAVIGASLAGLFAAAAISRAGHEAVLVERDQLGDTATPRAGVPQGEQPHVFLLRGLLAAEELLPGLRPDLESRGAVPFDSARVAWLGEHGWLKRAEGFEVLSLTRPLFEQVVREHVLRLDRVELRDDTAVKGLHHSDSPGRRRWGVETARPDADVDADLVVDASGRNSRLPEWLAALGMTTPKPSEIDARTGYSTRVYRDGPALPGISGIVLQTTPNCPIGGLALPVEGGRWLVVAFGRGDHRPPRDIAGFESFLHQLSEPAVADLIDRATPCSDVKVYRRNGNHRYHYEQMTDWPAGLLVVGDAFVAFNPVFGQGITVAACEAIVLRDQLAAGLGPGDARKLMGLFAATAALPWSIAVGQDVRQPTCDARQNVAQAVTNAWARELTRLAVHGNVRAAEVLTGIYHLMAAPTTMLHPALFGAALRAKIVGYGPANLRPAGLDAMVHS